MKYNWLLFDADGTLFDYDQAEANALQRAFDQDGLTFSEKSTAKYRKINNKIWDMFERGEIDSHSLRTKRFEILFGELGVSGIDLLDFSERYLKNLSEEACLLEGVTDVLPKLGEKYKMAIITNGLKDVQRSRFSRFPLLKLFEGVFISEEMGHQKPEIAYFETVFAGIGNPAKAETLVIGDSLTSDMQGANNYGVDACWMNPEGKAVPEHLTIKYQIKQFSDLLDLLS